MTGHRPWSEVRAEKARRDAERDRTPRRSLVVSTSFQAERATASEHTTAQLRVLIHPDVSVEAVRLALIEFVMTLNREYNAALEPEEFVHTRGPHEGQRADAAHTCVPECYEDQSEAIERAEYVDPRPEYRVIAEPWYDHEADERPYHYDGAHTADCVTGYGLEIAIRNPDVRGELGEWRHLGATQVVDLHDAKTTVVDYVRALAYPQVVDVAPDRVHVYVEVGDA